MSQSPDGGVAGREALARPIGPREGLVDVRLLSPTDRFEYRPMLVAEPFGSAEILERRWTTAWTIDSLCRRRRRRRVGGRLRHHCSERQDQRSLPPPRPPPIIIQTIAPIISAQPVTATTARAPAPVAIRIAARAMNPTQTSMCQLFIVHSLR